MKKQQVCLIESSLTTHQPDSAAHSLDSDKRPCILAFSDCKNNKNAIEKTQIARNE